MTRSSHASTNTSSVQGVKHTTGTTVRNPPKSTDSTATSEKSGVSILCNYTKMIWQKKKKKDDKKEKEEDVKPPQVIDTKNIDTQKKDAKLEKLEQILEEFSIFTTKEFPFEDPNSSTLHVACLKHYSTDLIVNHLLKHEPEAALKENSRNELPLHCALRDEKGVCDKVIDALLDTNPSSVYHANVDNSLPIHIACQSGAQSIYAIKCLLENHAEILMTQSRLKLPFDNRALTYIKSRDIPTTKEEEDVEVDDFFVVSTENTGYCFWSAAFKLPFSTPTPSFEELSTTEEEFSDPDTESFFSPLHLAVLHGAPPDVIELLLETNPECRELKTDKGRMAIDCAKFAVIDHVSSDECVSSVKNTFAAIEILQTYQLNDSKRKKLSFAVQSVRSLNTNVKLNSSNLSAFDAKKKWRKLALVMKMTSAVQKSLVDKSALGPEIAQDAEEAVIPDDFTPLPNLTHNCVDIELPLGFRRLRWALLHNSSAFFETEILEKKLNFADITIGPWDKHADLIGLVDTPADPELTYKSFIGTEQKLEYTVPKSALMSASKAYQTRIITEYNDYCFVIKSVTTTPNVPFGKTFETHSLMTFTNKGNNTCHLVGSVEARFVGKPPMIAWKIRSGIYSGVTDFFVAKTESIVEHAIDIPIDA